jgi:DinB family protein
VGPRFSSLHRAKAGVPVLTAAHILTSGIRETLGWMDSGRRITVALLDKVHEQIDKSVHLLNLIPADQLDWRPPAPDAWTAGLLIGHLLDCLAGFCAVLAAIEPQRLAHFAELRNLAVNHSCAPAAAITRIALYRTRIDEGFVLLDDLRLSQLLPTAFVPEGEPLITLMLGNLEHLINHKHQLFTYVKQMGIKVNTRDLYHFRGEPPAGHNVE